MSGVPFGLPRGIRQPADGGGHGGDGVGHMGEVDGAEFVAGLVVVSVEPEAGDGLSDDALEGKSIVVGAAEELLFWVRVVDEMSAMLRQFGAKIGAVEACEPESSSRNRGVRPPDHFKLEIGDDAGEGNGRVREEGGIPEAAYLFRAEESEDNRAFRAAASSEKAGEGENCGSPGGVVVGPVVDAVAVDGRTDAEVVEVGGEEDDFVGQCSAAEDGDGVPGLLAWRVLEFREALLEALGQRIRQRSLLEETTMIASGFKPEGLELRCGEESGDMLVACGGTAPVEFIIGEESHISLDFSLKLKET